MNVPRNLPKATAYSYARQKISTRHQPVWRASSESIAMPFIRKVLDHFNLEIADHAFELQTHQGSLPGGLFLLFFAPLSALKIEQKLGFRDALEPLGRQFKDFFYEKLKSAYDGAKKSFQGFIPKGGIFLDVQAYAQGTNTGKAGEKKLVGIVITTQISTGDFLEGLEILKPANDFFQSRIKFKLRD